MPEAPNRQQRVSELWSWLPAFRIVAERQQVQAAARELHVSASTLSRAVGLVEDRLGKKLFDRVGRTMRLNSHGRELLEALRDGMRRIDDGVALVTDSVFRGDVRIVAEGDQLLTPLSAALLRLRTQHDALTFTVWPSPPALGELETGLLRGRFDVAVVLQAPPSRKLVRVEQLGAVTYGVYAGKGHPLHRARRPLLADVLAHPFVAPTPSLDDAPGDHWPVDIDRRVVLHLPALAPAMDICARRRAPRGLARRRRRP